MVKTVVIYLEQNNQYLMLYRNKRIFDYNKNHFVGIGGHIEENETKEGALIREVKEETGYDLLDFKYCGAVLFKFNKMDEELMYVFHSKDFVGTLTNNDEGTLEWIPIKHLMDINIFRTDKIFLQDYFMGKYFEYTYYYDRNDEFIGYEKGLHI